ncbi:RusA family crossover junction endodeoxyribonuclease [Thermosulfurimonas sp. F29]|uniref:RusA family crossover junction endodeoxyribonuclease n=1 Tax=Thermosulfurimonas sp. F29 TaxID=2867247 RepID=UPI001C83431F|nr:RusA family crossover junction endodeoxyribonuclease [Thermosulfurimonas sp. F29]MBX6423443.1 RusA family crossover junction endodeoxyribonuclease [Thermosulfurimonas sp. F29]
MVSFFVRGIPKAQGRPRVVRFRNGRVGLKDPEASRDWKSYVRLVAAERVSRPIEGPVALELWFYLPVPKSFSRRKRLAALAGEVLPAKKPDLDNLVKAVLDALLGVVVLDDRQIVEIRAGKLYGAVPGVEIVLRKPKRAG